MDQVDDQTRQRIRDWQLRRLEIKDQIATHPERTYELTQLLDQMEEEHERILGEAVPAAQSDDGSPAAPSAQPEHESPAAPAEAGLDYRLSLSASNARDLRKLLEMALHELDTALADDTPHDQPRAYPGGMSGSLGTYAYELDITPTPDRS